MYPQLSEEDVAKNFVNAVFIFVIQMVLVLYALYQIFFRDEFLEAKNL